jgi:hypothetical protein
VFAIVIGAVAAGVAIIGAFIGLGKWSLDRAKKLDVWLTFSSVPPLRPGGPNVRIATVRVRNASHRPVVLIDFGIMRGEARRFREPRRLGNARSIAFLDGQRLEPDDLRSQGFKIDDLPADQGGTALPLWGFARISGKDKTFTTSEPLVVKDMRPGSPTAGQRIYP